MNENNEQIYTNYTMMSSTFPGSELNTILTVIKSKNNPQTYQPPLFLFHFATVKTHNYSQLTRGFFFFLKKYIMYSHSCS